MCVRENECVRERMSVCERERESEREREREIERACVYCVGWSQGQSKKLTNKMSKN